MPHSPMRSCQGPQLLPAHRETRSAPRMPGPMQAGEAGCGAEGAPGLASGPPCGVSLGVGRRRKGLFVYGAPPLCCQQARSNHKETPESEPQL